MKTGRETGGTARAVRGIGLAILVAATTPLAAQADGGADEPPPSRGGIKPRSNAVIEVVPRLDHHYRSDMVEPGWRTYGSQGYSDYGYGSSGRGFDPRYQSLDRQPGSGCDTWRNGCRPAEPWWTVR